MTDTTTVTPAADAKVGRGRPAFDAEQVRAAADSADYGKAFADFARKTYGSDLTDVQILNLSLNFGAITEFRKSKTWKAAVAKAKAAAAEASLSKAQAARKAKADKLRAKAAQLES